MYDIQKMKDLGFNTLRKHIKIEPEIFYYYCDKMGMIVWQDMVNNGRYSFIQDTALPTISNYQKKTLSLFKKDVRKAFFIQHVKDTMEALHNHPCIVYYTIFNEGWGQFDSDKMYEIVKDKDGSRLIDTTSGWFHGKMSDVHSLHIYFMLKNIEKADKPIVISEFGGFSYSITDNSYSLYGKYGYGNCESKEDFQISIEAVYDNMIIPGIKVGVNGSIYTQLSDVEDETNGFVTYDRQIVKVDQKVMLRIKEKIENAFYEDVSEEK